MHFHSTRFSATAALLVAIGMSACGDDPVSEGLPGDFSYAGTVSAGGASTTVTGGTTFGSGGTQGGRSSSGGSSGGTPAATSGGTKATGGSLGSSAGGSSGGSTSPGSSGGSSFGTTGGRSSSTGGRSGFGTGGRGSGGSGGSAPGGSSSGGKATGGGAAVAFSMVGSIVQDRCSSCHGFTMPLLQNNAMLRNTLTSTRVPECGNNPLVTPNDPSKSAVLMLVNRMCGMLVMPAGCGMTPCIPAAEVTTLTNWINAGAPP